MCRVLHLWDRGFLFPWVFFFFLLAFLFDTSSTEVSISLL